MKYFMEKDMRLCQACKGEYFKDDLVMVCDNYGIPYKLVCSSCLEEVQEEARSFCYDSMMIGEYLYDVEEY